MAATGDEGLFATPRPEMTAGGAWLSAVQPLEIMACEGAQWMETHDHAGERHRRPPHADTASGGGVVSQRVRDARAGCLLGAILCPAA